MRITVDSSLGGTLINPQVTQVKVILNGKQVEWCICADSDKGEVIVPERDMNGHVITDNSLIRYQTLKGKVDIDFRHSRP